MSTTVEEKEARRIQRIAIPLPVRVEVNVNSKMSWNEVTRLSDISAFGAGFSLKRPLKRGRLTLLTIPMPKQLRVYDFTEEQYRVWACVRRCLPVSIGSEEKKYVIGVAFIGKTPPSSYISDPSTLYEISQRETDGLWKLSATNGDWDELSGQRMQDGRRACRYRSLFRSK
jgi:PilZ domain.